MILITLRIMIIIIVLLLFFVALVYHVPQFLEKCGCIFKVNCQPVEKKKKKQWVVTGFIVVQKRVAGTPSTQYRSWRKKIESFCKSMQPAPKQKIIH